MKVFSFLPPLAQGCTVTAWLQPELARYPHQIHPAIVICPGGGYRYVSEREGEPVAKAYYAAGFHTFVLDYSVEDQAAGFRPLLQLAATVAEIRRRAPEWKVDPHAVAVCGFSAGGHLAASLGVLFQEPRFLQACPFREDIRPDAMVLGYPVITADAYVDRETIDNVSGYAPADSPEYHYWGLDKHVTSQTPPAFLWHTAQDEEVPVENSLRFAAALSACRVPYELHILPEGAHGLSVCTREVDTPHPYNSRWLSWSIAWLNRTLSHEA